MWVGGVDRPFHNDWSYVRALMELSDKDFKAIKGAIEADRSDPVLSGNASDRARSALRAVPGTRMKEALTEANRFLLKRSHFPDFVSSIYLSLYMTRMARAQARENINHYVSLWIGARLDPKKGSGKINSMLELGFGHRFRKTVSEDIDAIFDSEILRYVDREACVLAGKNYYDAKRVLPQFYERSDDEARNLRPPHDEEAVEQIFEWVRKAGFGDKMIKQLRTVFDGSTSIQTNPFHPFFKATVGHADAMANYYADHNAIVIPSDQSLMNYRSWVVPKDTPDKYRLIQAPNRQLKAILRNVHARFSCIDNEGDTLIAYYKGADYVKRLKREKIQRPGLVTLDLKDWYHQVNVRRILSGLDIYYAKAGALRKLDQSLLSQPYRKETSEYAGGNKTKMDRAIELLQLQITDLTGSLLKYPVKLLGKQIVRTLIYDLLKMLLPQIILLRRHRPDYSHPDHNGWDQFLHEHTVDAARRELFLDNPDLMFIPASPRRVKKMFGSEKVLTAKLVNALGTLVPYQATKDLDTRTFDSSRILALLSDKVDIPAEKLHLLKGQVTLATIRECTGRSIAECRLTLRDLELEDGPRVFALAQGAPTSGCLANFFFAADLLPGLRHRLERLKDQKIIEGYDVLVYSDNLGIFFTPHAGASHEIATRKILKESRGFFQQRSILVNDFKIQDYEGNDKKFLGLIIDEAGNVRVRREYLREVNQIIINLGKNENINYKGTPYSREDMSILCGMVQWIKRTRSDSPYARKIKEMRWLKRRAA